MMKGLGQALATRLQQEWWDGVGKSWPWLSIALWPLSLIYRLISVLRGQLYRHHLYRTEALPVPVIVVGNWIVGGAGKTPTTLALLSLLRSAGLKAGVVSRGYGRNSDVVTVLSKSSQVREVGDEPLLIHLRTGAPVAVGRDRVAAARALLQAHPELQVLVSDDGLQHLRMPRALSIVVFDERGIGNGRVLPSGPLRQAFRKHVAPTELVLYNAALPTTPLPGFTAKRGFGGAVSLDGWWQGEAAQVATLQLIRQAAAASASTRPGPQVWAAAGMAHPQRFFDMLSALGLAFTPLPLPDHFNFAELPWQMDAAHVLVTEKDAVKLDPRRCAQERPHTQVWVITLDFCPEPAFDLAVRAQLCSLGLIAV
ncbi:tetraacyldisaccharide 4'-kinase [Roseateles koreensis]|uniref:Tetraacyldisaccharide 4'-kinase n=1 Tax=Roseateles koreensis TaxID=2987526 RepID=A0ABT5KQ20_9BURK|nr:tetraacyldisaccharide 4'-kinase [Roseateles koreensis]MDC8783877.1 tetraacyldisaccharide 4'-kinase [Roseateles koreensis]